MKPYEQLEDVEIIDNLNLATIVGAINCFLISSVVVALLPRIWPEFRVGMMCSLFVSLPLINVLSLRYYKKFRNINWLFFRFAVLDTFVLTSILHYSGEIKSTIIFIYLVPIIMAAPIFSLRRVISLVMIYSVSYLCLILLESLGVILPISTPGIDIAKGYFWTISVVALILLAAVGIIISKAITQRREKEFELAQARDFLRAKSKELESFVYIVSHDLKAPLASIEGFAYSLLNEYKDKLAAEGRHYLQRIQANIGQMETLIKDLLELSRVGRVIGRLDYIDTFKITKGLQEEFTGQLSKEGIEFIVAEPLPEPWGDKDRVRQVFENLISNAIKFTKDRKNPKIEIGAKTRADDFYQFYVKDNGIGIDPRYHDKVFEIFQRLKDVDVEGTGVGLSTVKKIIEHHGGKIWLESEKGKGSTFCFTLPKKEV
ncbi:MAG: GHKL domain-containing protein [Candidatus Omnitrophica bacterium]|nr:GHKL domain-containing protein [Candidatus Omnitrophota bacterium]MBU1851658.1 GHKL domain-containing protein [Candidatus Omnitrophota bacterium]